jgi:uncharacterized protein (TIGR02284 family)
MHDKTSAILDSLLAICRDGVDGFELASHELKSSELQSLFLGYSLQRSRMARELEAAISAVGDGVSEAGGKSSRTWMMPEAGKIRDEHAVLTECERGEDAALAAYALALQERELPTPVRGMITAQAAEVKAAQGEVKGLRTRFAPVAVSAS